MDLTDIVLVSMTSILFSRPLHATGILLSSNDMGNVQFETDLLQTLVPSNMCLVKEHI